MSHALVNEPASEADLRAHRDLVHAFEDKVIRKLPLIEIETKHHFAHGVYAREVFLPKGTTATGMIHKYENLNIIAQGEIWVLTENGPIRRRAPQTFVSPPGTKRLVHAHEDTVWITILGTQERDIDKAVAELVVADEAEYARFLGLQHDKLPEIT